MAHWSGEGTRPSGAPEPPERSVWRPGDGSYGDNSESESWDAPQDLWYPGDGAPPADSATRQAAYVEAVDATRFDLPVLPISSFDPRTLELLIPPKRGEVQGPGTRVTEAPATATGARPAARATAGRGRLLGGSASMAMGTMVSRLTGVLRSPLQVAALSTGVLASTYTLGNTLPNMIYILIIGGALNSVFVPQLVRAMSQDRDGGRAFTDRLLTLTMVMLAALTVITVVAAPWIIDLYTPSNFSHSDHQLTVIFARYCLPQIFFYGLFVMFSQILNARDRFGPTGWTTVLNNVVVIATFGAFLMVAHGVRTTETITPAETRLVGIGTTLGIVVQTLTLIPYLRQVGVRYRPRFDWRGVGLSKSFTLAKWTILFVLVNQAGNLVVTRLATAVDNANPNAGIGYAAYTQAFMIFGLPQGVITVSLITAMLPRMARAAASSNLGAVREDISQGLRVSGVGIVPAAFAFVAFGPQIAVVLFLHGHESLTQAHMIGYMLMAFGLGLIPFSAQYLMLRGFYAFEDTRTPFTINIWIAALNAGLSALSYVALEHTRWPVVGMCAAYAVAYVIGMGITARRLSRRLRGLDSRRVRRTYARLIVASVPAGVVGFALAYGCNAVAGQGFLGSLLAIVLGGAAMIMIFLVMARRMRIAEVDAMLGIIRSRVGR